MVRKDCSQAGHVDVPTMEVCKLPTATETDPIVVTAMVELSLWLIEINQLLALMAIYGNDDAWLLPRVAAVDRRAESSDLHVHETALRVRQQHRERGGHGAGG
eukprot:CAMPEP_0115507702 /NCGR_PEP_ID=MMETSP0271-20121206/71878_1 /TAXON_ID=71861 /ORGANISM="Scrippsiella trochoidea, Strain CCMP3099" /LENGTH=102 /DNA_ID=CAMNT_0002937333 /DNA_START=398 /DNA_END=706 /DNA_ORIENTATION=-